MTEPSNPHDEFTPGLSRPEGTVAPSTDPAQDNAEGEDVVSSSGVHRGAPHRPQAEADEDAD
jgi:hypothetical protein